MKLIGKVHRLRRHQAAVAKASLVFAILIGCANATGTLYAATIAEIAVKIRSLKPQERTGYLLKGAQAEGELVYYGTLPIDEFLPLARVFNGRYRSIALQHYFSPRDGILSRTLTEARAGRHAADVIQVDLSYGYQLLNANLVQPQPIAGAKRFYDGTYDPDGYWHSMYYLTTALIYNTNSIKAEQAPKSYDELLSPAWKGKMLFDPEAGYILAAMEESWGREKAVDYLTKLAKQDLSYRRGGTLDDTSGDFGRISGRHRDQWRDFGGDSRKRARRWDLKFSRRRSSNPKACFWRKTPLIRMLLCCSSNGCSPRRRSLFWRRRLGKGSAMKGVRSKFKDFQVKPDFVVNPKLGANLQNYIQEFRKIMGAP